MVVNFCVPTLWNDEFLLTLDRLNNKFSDISRICEIYGSKASNFIGTARPTPLLPKITDQDMKEHIKLAHKLGIKVAYTLNASCTGNVDLTEEGRKRLIDFLDSLKEAGIDNLIINSPYILDVAAERNFKVTVSSIAQVDSVNKALMYKDKSRICLDYSLNRNFELIKSIRKAVKSELQVLVNDPCLIDCPYKAYHYNTLAHYSQEVMTQPLMRTDYPSVLCFAKRFSEPKEIIKSPWIRPEDVKLYSDFGIDYIKVSGRGRPREELINLIRAYVSQDFSGNLADLIGIRPETRIQGSPKLDIYIDNKKLSNFLDYFNGNYPCKTGCEDDCNYCKTIADQVVEMDKESQKALVTHLEKLKEDWIRIK